MKIFCAVNFLKAQHFSFVEIRFANAMGCRIERQCKRDLERKMSTLKKVHAMLNDVGEGSLNDIVALVKPYGH